MKVTPFLTVFFILLFVVGCTTPAPRVTPDGGQTTGKVVDVGGLGDDLTDIDTVARELDTSDLDTVDEDLSLDF